MAKIRTKVIEIVLLIALAVIAQIIVGVLGQVSYASGQSFSFTFNSATANSVNAININSANALTVTLSGAYGWISNVYPLSVTITGNTATGFATNTAFATSSTSNTLSFILVNSTTTQTLLASGSSFYNITKIQVSGITPAGEPSFGVQITQPYIGVVHGSAPTSNTANSISATNTLVVTASQATNNYNTAGTSVTTVLNFMSIVFLVAALVILLSLFGLDKILSVNKGRND